MIVIETLVVMCQVPDDQLLKYLLIMLTGYALSFFSTYLKDLSDYSNAIRQLQRWYNSEEKIDRILTAWQTMTLSRAMAERTDQS